MTSKSHRSDDASRVTIPAAIRANWLPALADQFCLVIRAYFPTTSILENIYQFPDVVRAVS